MKILHHEGRLYVNYIWRALAIVFIILFVIETLLVIWLFSAGLSDINKENECISNICEGLVGDYDSFAYDELSGFCQCFKNGKLIKTEYIK